MEKIIKNSFCDLDSGDEICFGFQGGEPTLAGLSWFRGFTELAGELGDKKNVSVKYALQTNGLVLDEHWCRFFKEHNFLLGLSLDGGESLHNQNRLKPDGGGTFREVMAAKKLLDEFSVEYNILCVLTNALAGDPDRVWRFILNESISYIQFIPCMDEMDRTSRFALKPARFASFYKRLFSMWRREVENGRYISVKFFDDVANLFYKKIQSACGITGKCQIHFVIESDGTVYPCDFYALDKFNSGNLGEKTLGEIKACENAAAFLADKSELPKMCSACDYFRACGGGCKRMRDIMYCAPGEVMCGYKSFLDKCLLPLGELLRRYF